MTEPKTDDALVEAPVVETNDVPVEEVEVVESSESSEMEDAVLMEKQAQLDMFVALDPKSKLEFLQNCMTSITGEMVGNGQTMIDAIIGSAIDVKINYAIMASDKIRTGDLLNMVIPNLKYEIDFDKDVLVIGEMTVQLTDRDDLTSMVKNLSDVPADHVEEVVNRLMTFYPSDKIVVMTVEEQRAAREEAAKAEAGE